MFTDLGMEFDFIDMTDLANVEKFIKPNTKMIFSESPANPTLTLTDLSAVSKLAKSKVDNAYIYIYVYMCKYIDG